MALPTGGHRHDPAAGRTRRQRLAGLGQAIAGFGVSFSLRHRVPAGRFRRCDAPIWSRSISIRIYGLAVPVFVLLGFILTVITQVLQRRRSPLPLTASAGGSKCAACAGGGGRSSAPISAPLQLRRFRAAIGATAPARRVAAAPPSIFNVFTAIIAHGVAALADRGAARRLPDGLWGDASITVGRLPSSTPSSIRLGVLAIAGVARRLIDWLGTRFVTQEERIGQPRFLDATLVEVPRPGAAGPRPRVLAHADIAFEVARARASARPKPPGRALPACHMGCLAAGQGNRVDGSAQSLDESGGSRFPHRLPSRCRISFRERAAYRGSTAHLEPDRGGIRSRGPRTRCLAL